MAYENVKNDLNDINLNYESLENGLMWPFYTKNDSTPLTKFVRFTLTATDSTEPGSTVYSADYGNTRLSDVIWWRGISGTPGNFSNFRIVDATNEGTDHIIRFAATWDGFSSKPNKTITGYGLVEAVIRQNY